MISINRLSDVLRPLARPCWPKEQHRTAGAASAQMRSLLNRGLEKDATRIRVYQCEHCTFPDGAPVFHVGHWRA